MFNFFTLFPFFLIFQRTYSVVYIQSLEHTPKLCFLPFLVRNGTAKIYSIFILTSFFEKKIKFFLLHLSSAFSCQTHQHSPALAPLLSKHNSLAGCKDRLLFCSDNNFMLLFFVLIFQLPANQYILNTYHCNIILL